MKTYTGRRIDGRVEVMVAGTPLDPRHDLWDHSLDGFEWGYGGSGPAQLALAILADHLGDDRRAIALHQEFKWSIVAGLPQAAWTLTSEEIAQALESLS